MSAFISRVGIELEGGWTTKQLLPLVQWDERQRYYVFPIQNDESLIHGEFESEHVGEIASPPLRTTEVVEWLRNAYPSEVNQACGFHVHTSFRKTAYYKELMDRRFYNYFLHEMELWFKANKEAAGPLFASRLHGGNKYCTKDWLPAEQVSLKSKHPHGNQANQHLRRTQLNFCWGLHKTIECRLFPMWADPAVAEMALVKLFSIYEDYLRGTKIDQRGRSVSLTARSGHFVTKRNGSEKEGSE